MGSCCAVAAHRLGTELPCLPPSSCPPQVAFVPQDDTLPGSLTVEECIRCSALLRLPPGLPPAAVQVPCPGRAPTAGLPGCAGLQRAEARCAHSCRVCRQLPSARATAVPCHTHPSLYPCVTGPHLAGDRRAGPAGRGGQPRGRRAQPRHQRRRAAQASKRWQAGGGGRPGTAGRSRRAVEGRMAAVWQPPGLAGLGKQTSLRARHPPPATRQGHHRLRAGGGAAGAGAGRTHQRPRLLCRPAAHAHAQAGARPAAPARAGSAEALGAAGPTGDSPRTHTTPSTGPHRPRCPSAVSAHCGTGGGRGPHRAAVLPPALPSHVLPAGPSVPAGGRGVRAGRAARRRGARAGGCRAALPAGRRRRRAHARGGWAKGWLGVCEAQRGWGGDSRWHRPLSRTSSTDD